MSAGQDMGCDCLLPVRSLALEPSRLPSKVGGESPSPHARNRPGCSHAQPTSPTSTDPWGVSPLALTRATDLVLTRATDLTDLNRPLGSESLSPHARNPPLYSCFVPLATLSLPAEGERTQLLLDVCALSRFSLVAADSHDRIQSPGIVPGPSGTIFGCGQRVFGSERVLGRRPSATVLGSAQHWRGKGSLERKLQPLMPARRQFL